MPVRTYDEFVGLIKDDTRTPSLAHLSVDDLLDGAGTVADALRGGGDALNTQVYKVLGHVRRLQQRFSRTKFEPKMVRLIEPRLEWSAYRVRELKFLTTVLRPALRKVNDEADFRHFIELVQAIVAKHRFGREHSASPQGGPPGARGQQRAGAAQQRHGGDRRR